MVQDVRNEMITFVIQSPVPLHKLRLVPYKSGSLCRPSQESISGEERVSSVRSSVLPHLGLAHT